MKHWCKVLTILSTGLFACAYSINLKCEEAHKNQELAALFIGFGSKVIMDTLTREYTFKAFNSSLSQPAHTLDDTHTDTAREIAEEIARTLLLAVIKKNFEHILQTAYPNSNSLQETLKQDLVLGMSLIPFKNFVLVSKELTSLLVLPLFCNQRSIARPANPYQVYSFDSVYLTGSERSITQASAQELLNKTYLLKLQNEIPQLTQIKQEVLEKLLMSLAPFLGATFTELSFRIGQKIAFFIAQHIKSHTYNSTIEVLQKLIHSTVYVFFLEELKMSFNTLVESLIDYSEEKEEMLYVLTRFGEKLYIVLKVVAPAYTQLYMTVANHA